MSPKPPAPEPSQPVIWSATGRPHASIRRWAWFLALLCLGASTLLLPMLSTAGFASWYPLLGALIGAGLGAMIIAGVQAGSRLTLHADGQLVYHLGKRPNFHLPIQAISAWGFVDAGCLRGCAAVAPLTALHFLHRKGISPAIMQRQSAIHGYSIVFEFIGPEHLDALRSHQRTWLAAEQDCG